MPWRPTCKAWQGLRPVARQTLPRPSLHFKRSNGDDASLNDSARNIRAVLLPPDLNESHRESRNTHVELRRSTDKKSELGALDVIVHGLVRSVRKQKSIAFAHIQDGSTYEPIQAVLKPEMAKNITNGAYIELAGKWLPSSAKGQSHELWVESIFEIGASNAEEHPIQKKSTSDEFLRTVSHLRMRTPLLSLVTRARSLLMSIVGKEFRKPHWPREKAMQIHPPVITSSDCEGAGEVFTINPRNPQSFPGEQQKHFFKEPKYLTVSNQLHLEAYSAELGNVWALAPTFRAETSDTPRHLAEFYMLEAEFRGVTHLETLIGHAQRLIQAITLRFRGSRIAHDLINYYNDTKHRPAGFETIDLVDRWRRVLNPSGWQRVEYYRAIEQMKEDLSANFAHEPNPNAGLQLEHERWIVEKLGHGEPVVVKNFPRHLKPFYMLPTQPDQTPAQPTDPDQTPKPTAACFDILFPCGYAEICGGSLREHRLEPLIGAMREKGLLKQNENASPEPEYPFLERGESLGSLQWYADLRRFGSSPHGGFGIGFDRLLAYLTGPANVRDVVGFPRTYGRADC